MADGREVAFEMAASSVRYGVGVTREIGMDLADRGHRRVMVITDQNVGTLRPVTTVLESLAENGVVAMLMDRHLGRDRVQVSFLGRQAAFLGTPALMGYLSEAPLLPCFIERLGPGRFSIQPGEPIFVSRELPRGEAVHTATQAFAAQLEARIRANPHHWYQFYPYWKAQDGSYDGLID